ncbi:hypothetical protein KC19_5G108100 [Ceratodon purpureus]|uniref:Uncharacterized protein n=1 Tax=Ceratodon purpureus TaxID=3225 RepID=A0A8T0I044_CERPU|nr:hypothetical protein KC19_5G108100 [Ceratodon purpureus]
MLPILLVHVPDVNERYKWLTFTCCKNRIWNCYDSRNSDLLLSPLLILLSMHLYLETVLILFSHCCYFPRLTAIRAIIDVLPECRLLASCSVTLPDLTAVD